jgi:hypothetical protein
MDLNTDPTHIAWRCGTEDPRLVVSDLEGALADAKARRDKILINLGKAAVAIDKGDQRARFVQRALNKQEDAAGRLVLSIAKQLEWARKHVRMAANQADAVELKRLQSDAAPKDKWFEIICPDGRKVRHRHSSMGALQKELTPGYRALGQVFGANEDGTGGFISSPGAPSMLKALLESDGDVLMEWLAARGVVGGDKTVIVLPENGRAAQ